MDNIMKYFLFYCFFFIECNVGYYGKNCNNMCGYCWNKIFCYYVNGICDEECDFGYLVLYCFKGM